MRQMPGIDRDIACRNGHVLADHSLDRKIALDRVRILKILTNMQRKWQYRAEAGKSCRIEPLKAELIFGRGRDTQCAGSAADGRARSLNSAYGAVENLESIEQTGRRWAANGNKRRLLLLRAIADVRIESN